MPNMNVSEFKSNFDGGSRSNRFLISGEIGGNGGKINEDISNELI